MTRRDLVQLVVKAAATPAAAAFFAAWLHGSEHHSTAQSAPSQSDVLHNYQPKFFGKSDFEALEALTIILIPTDETPGAREARCADFIDFVLHASSDEPQVQKRWLDAMRLLRQTGFHGAEAGRRAAIVSEISRPERDASARHPAYPAYRLIKRENAFAFYTSRAGIIEALDYRGNTYNESFPACTHPEHHVL